MKVIDLLEGKVSPAWRKKFEARITLMTRNRGAWKIKFKNKKEDEVSGDAIDDIYKKAKVKFNEMVEAHPDGLCFASLTEANEHLASMEYPGWPMEIEKKNGYGKSRNEPVEVDYKEATLDDVKVEKLENGRYLVSIKATRGPALSAFLGVFHSLYKSKRYSKDGKQELTYSWRGNAFQTAATEKQIAAATKSTKHVKDTQAAEKAQKETPEYKKEKNKADYAYRKEKLAKEKQADETRAYFKEKIGDILKKYWTAHEAWIEYVFANYYNADTARIVILFAIDERSPVLKMVDMEDESIQNRLKDAQKRKEAKFAQKKKDFMAEIKKLDEYEGIDFTKSQIEIRLKRKSTEE